MITTDLAQVKSLHVLERVRVQYLLAEMQLGQTGIVEEKTAPRAGRLLGAENLIVGSLEPGSLAARASVASTTTEDVIGTFYVAAEPEEFFILQKEIVYNILQVLPVTFTPEEEKHFSRYHTKNLQAVLYLGHGLDVLDAGQWKEAKMLFMKAIEEDPEFELARYYGEHCPAATAAAISSLGAMTVGELVNNVAAVVDEASAGQAASASEQGGGPGEEASTTGSVSISWGPGEEASTTGSVSISW